ncbi:MAG: hypothetical protein K5675_01120 [Lachnospiraceae bacterium]|nr:hypothetical protein [Lachnospiraceae bacterium]
MNKGQYVRKYLYVLILLLQVFLAFGFVLFMDVQIIVNWLLTFWDCVWSGSIREYAQALIEAKNPSNYNILLNIIMAMGMFPIYAIDRLMKLGISIDAFCIWFKALILLANLGTEYYVIKIAEHYNAYEKTKIIMFYLTSVFLLYGSLALGQIDCFGNFFAVLAFWEWIRKKHGRMCLWMSLAIMFKGLAAFLLIPIFLLEFGKSYLQIIKYGMIFLIMPLVSMIFGKYIFLGYGAMVSEVNHTSYDFYERIFENSLWNTSIVVVFLVCLSFYLVWKSHQGNVVQEDYIFYPLLMFCGFITFVVWHPQWMIYCTLFLAIALTKIEERYAIPLGFLLNSSYILFIATRWVTYGSNGCIDNMMVQHSLMAKLIHRVSGKVWLETHIIDYLPQYTMEISVSVFMGCLFIVLFLLWKKKTSPSQEVVSYSRYIPLYNEVMVIIQLLPIIGFIVVSYALYLKNLV